MIGNNAYHFITEWRLQATRQEVIDILSNAEALPRWWPSVYLDVQELEPGDENHVGRRISLYTKGWLPYTLRWDFRVTEVSDHRLQLVAEGDFVGRGIWTIQEDGAWVNVTYDWQIEAEKPLLKRLSFLLKPIFSMNHHWAMAKGEESLRLEIQRRHAKSEVERQQIPAPPPATPDSLPLWLIEVLNPAALLMLPLILVAGGFYLKNRRK